MRSQVPRLLLAAAFLVAGLAFAPGAGASPWTQVETFGDVGTGEFRAPQAVDVDSAGNLYVVDQDMSRIQKRDPTGAFLSEWGSEGAAEGQFSSPAEIAVDAAGGGVYVTDNYNDRVEKFDTSGNFISAWGWGVSDGSAAYQVCTTGCRAGISGTGAGQFSSAIGIATDGLNVYVADYDNKRIDKFDLAGAHAGQWAIPGAQSPEGLTVADSKVYVTTTADKVWRFDKNGVPDASWDGDGVTAASGTGAGQLKGPKGVAVDAGGVYVADSGNHRITKFDLNGTFSATWGTQGSADAQFNYPYGVLATGGTVWVVDSYNHRLQRFSPAGVHQLTVGSLLGAGDFYYPADVAVAPSGDVYVADWSGDDVQRLSASGTPIARWGTGPHGPLSVTPTATGVYVPDGSHRVRLYDSTGGLLDQFGSPGSDLGQFDFPGGSTTDADGNLYVVDRANHRVQKLTPAGAPVAAFGSYGSGNGQLNYPYDVAVDATGNLYVTDTSNNRIEKFGPGGAYLAKWGSAGTGDGQFRNPTGVALDSAGHVFVSDYANNRIQEFDASGNFIAKWGTFGNGPGELWRPGGLSVDSAGALWVADTNNHRIVRFCCPAAPKAPAPDGAPAPQAPAPPGDASADTTAPLVKLSGRLVQRSRLVGRRGLAIRVATSERAKLTLRAAISRRVARRLGLRSPSVGRVTADLPAAGSQGLRLRLSVNGRRVLRRSHSVRVVVRASAADPAGNRAAASLALTVRR